MPERERDAGLLALSWGRMAWAAWPGEDPPLMLLEGTGCDIDDWAGVLDALPDRIRVVALDFRGHGLSDSCETPCLFRDLADDVLAFVEHLGAPRVVLAGHSLGGMVALEAARRSARVGGLVLLEGWTNGYGAGDAFEGPGHHYGTLDAGAIDLIGRKLGRTQGRFPEGVWRGLVETVRAFDAHDYLRAATIPIVEVYGEAGRTDQTEAKLAVPPNPHIHWRWVPGAGHYLPHERPREVADACALGWDLCRAATPETETRS